MHRSPSLRALARLGVRLVAVWLLFHALWRLLANLAEAVPEFDPSYLGFFVRTQLLSPLIGLALGAFLFALAPALGRLLARGDE
ncbi:MAG: hypothetical protein ACLFU2_09140 [Opitutales bacterium]